MDWKNSPEFKKTLSFCGSNIRCESEVRYRVSKYNISDENKQNILTFLKNYKFYFEDTYYLEKYFQNIELNLDNPNFYKLYTKDKIKNKLMSKKIPSRLIDMFLKDFVKMKEDTMLDKFVVKNQRKILQKDLRLRVSYVASKGFSLPKVIKVLKSKNLL